MAGFLLMLIFVTVLVILFRAWLDRKDLSYLPYERERYLLSRAERTFFEVLCRAAGDRFYVCPKVRLADVVSVPAGANRWSGACHPRSAPARVGRVTRARCRSGQMDWRRTLTRYRRTPNAANGAFVGS